MKKTTWMAGLLLLATTIAYGHPGHEGHGKEQKKEPAKVAAPAAAEVLDVDGQGDWRFRYRPDLSTVPVDDKILLQAHGGFAVDTQGDSTTYFGLPGAGVIHVSPDLKTITVKGGSPELFNPDPKGGAWNYHNATPIYRGNELYLGLPSNNGNRVWITKPDGTVLNTLHAPPGSNGGGPTDLLQIPESGEALVTYGYGDLFIYRCDPFGDWCSGRFGGPGPREKLGVFSRAHGITAKDHDLFVAADREYGRVQLLDYAGQPHGVWDYKTPDTEDKDEMWPNPCDVAFSPDGKFAVIGNLNGIKGTTATFYIVDATNGNLLSMVTPAKLGVPNSRHIHNAVFRYVTTPDGKTEIYVLCLFWNPGGYAVFQLVA